MDELFAEVLDGGIKKVHEEEEEGHLEVQLGIQDFYD